MKKRELKRIISDLIKERVTIHRIKIEPSYFSSVKEKIKTFELRKNDRDYKVGDILVLSEYVDIPDSINSISIDSFYTGSEVIARVKYIMDKPVYGLQSEYCIISIEVV